MIKKNGLDLQSLLNLSKLYLATAYNLIIEGILSSIYVSGLYQQLLTYIELYNIQMSHVVISTSIEEALKRNKCRELSVVSQRLWYKKIMDSVDTRFERVIEADDLSSSEVMQMIRKDEP